MKEDTSPARILIIEDEALIAREIKHRLINMGWIVVGTAFGEEAIELALETSPDLLLSDIHLRRGLSGIDLARRIQDEIDVPVVFLTAYSDEDTVARAKEVTPYGYIIKPVDNRDLQITIEMALYKFRVERELKEQQQLLQTAFACIGDALVFLNDAGRIININPEARQLIGEQPTAGDDWHGVFRGSGSAVETIENAIADRNVARVAPFLLQRDDEVTHLLDGIVGPMENGVVLILRNLGEIEDPVQLLTADTHLADSDRNLLLPSESAFCQLLISPDQVDDDRAVQIVEDVRHRLDVLLRSTDLASILGDTMVSISMPYTGAAEGERIARTLLEALEDYQLDQEAVSFSAGMSNSVSGDHQPIELFRRAVTALDMARRSGGGRLWVDGGEASIARREFQGSKDYRHVVLLWNVMNSLTTAGSLEEMCTEFCQHLFQVFRPERVGLLSLTDDRLSLATGFIRDKGKTEHISDLHLAEADFVSIRAAARDRVLKAGKSGAEDTLIVPVSARMVLIVSAASLEADDQAYLDTLCRYFATSVERFDVAITDIEAETDERELIFESAAMRQVLETAELAAPTDATVLVTGESGTGKEMLARYIHQKGDRSGKPLVIVDCGAVAPGLIESELFGHVKGAFTGATANFNGRLKEADGGTVLLDEVGELPLETQVKLLRFVQDHEVASVGSNQYSTVDTRVIAATNRDLREMVEAGEFREDLYYRLNVFAISVPPLRDRREDILKLARHFLANFARRYNKIIRGFSPEAEKALLEYNWPGNIRELSNVINRSVILSKEPLITPIHLGLFSEPSPQVAEPSVVKGRSWIDMVVAAIDLGIRNNNPIPVGRYLEEDFILMSLNRHDEVLNRAALAIGVPETTLRRRIQKIESLYGSTDPDRPVNWPVFPQFYDGLIADAQRAQTPPLELLVSQLMKELQARDISKTLGARLLDVSMPTYRRLSD